MRILSKTSKGKFLVEITERELANIVGEDYYHNVSGKIDAAIREEKQLQISDIFDKYSVLNNTIKEKSYQDARRKLEMLISVLTPIESLLSKLNDNDEISENTK